ncbi:MAG: DUF4386 domain-containing protein [Chitinophagales bacterium]|nr:DUF4386 domain-containing protein [Chitinophagales bacterium]
MNPNNKTTETSPQILTRAGGVLYLIIIVAGIFSELFIRSKLIVSGDPAATAHNIIASQFLWRLGIAGDLLMHVCDVPLMVIFYVLLRPVNKNLALIAVVFNLVQTAVMVSYKLNLFHTLFLLGSSDYLKAFNSSQLNTLAYLSIREDEYGFGMGLIFFGIECLVLGYLIIKSGYLPGTIGYMMQIAGLCYLINSFALILAPSFANIISPAILIPSFIGELSFCLWLLLKGVNINKWKLKQTTLHVTTLIQT